MKIFTKIVYTILLGTLFIELQSCSKFAFISKYKIRKIELSDTPFSSVEQLIEYISIKNNTSPLCECLTHKVKNITQVKNVLNIIKDNEPLIKIAFQDYKIVILTLNIAYKNSDTMLGEAAFELLKDMINIMSYCDGMLIEFLNLIVGNNTLVKDFYINEVHGEESIHYNKKVVKLMRDILLKTEKKSQINHTQN